MKGFTVSQFPIGAVIAWVNGANPVLAEKFPCSQNLDHAGPQPNSLITEWLDKRLPGRLDAKED